MSGQLNAPAGAANNAPAKPAAFSDIAKPGSVSAVVSVAPAKTALPPVASAGPRPRLSDIMPRNGTSVAGTVTKPAATTLAPPAPNPEPSVAIAPTPPPPLINTAPNPAQKFHASPAPAEVLDLRPATSDVPAPEAGPTPVAVNPVNPAPSVPLVPAIPQNQGSRHEERLQRAAAVPKSDLVKRFRGSGSRLNGPINTSSTDTLPVAEIAATPVTAPTTEPVAARLITEPPEGPLTEIGEAMAKLELANPPVEAPHPAAPELPAQVGAQVESMQQFIPTSNQAKLPPGPKPKALLGTPSYVAAALAVVIMGGYIWMKNYPHLEIQVAAGKAGIEASMPGYIPSGYRLDGPVAYAPGEITLNFRASDGEGRLAIAQRKSSWTSEALLDNYVRSKSDDFITVENQGLNIYLYNGNEASWVNHGVWYTVEGTTKLNRDQILRIVNSL